ncbi:hypothetical protein K8R47_03620 [archaeon]|nr:hypothetical protein [archaeon]
MIEPNKALMVALFFLFFGFIAYNSQENITGYEIVEEEKIDEGFRFTAWAAETGKNVSDFSKRNLYELMFLFSVILVYLIYKSVLFFKHHGRVSFK